MINWEFYEASITYMYSALINTDWIIHVAYFLTLCGFLIRDQLLLRFLVTMGSSCFIVFYLSLSTPLLVPAFWSAATIAANIVVMAIIYYERTQFGLSNDEKILYKFMNALTPGEFRRLIKLCSWHDVDEKMRLTKVDKPVDALYFILKGQVEVKRKRKVIIVGEHCFIGELALVLSKDASATTYALPGAQLVSWEAAALREFLGKNPKVKIVLDNILNIDMARKLHA